MSINRVAKAVFYLFLSLGAVYCVGRWVWRFSGSDQWELVSERNGAKVYSLKEPGTDLKQFRGSVTVQSTLGGAVAWLQDPATCKDAGCRDPKTIERVDDQLQYVSMRFNMPKPFRPREFVMRVQFHQIPSTGEIWVEYAGAPDKAPQNSCCFRVADMSNTWRLTPLGSGQLELEYTMNMDWGGFFPDVLSNTMRPKYMMMQLQAMQGYLSRDKYKNTTFAFINERN